MWRKKPLRKKTRISVKDSGIGIDAAPEFAQRWLFHFFAEIVNTIVNSPARLQVEQQVFFFILQISTPIRGI